MEMNLSQKSEALIDRYKHGNIIKFKEILSNSTNYLPIQFLSQKSWIGIKKSIKKIFKYFQAIGTFHDNQRNSSSSFKKQRSEQIENIV